MFYVYYQSAKYQTIRQMLFDSNFIAVLHTTRFPIKVSKIDGWMDGWKNRNRGKNNVKIYSLKSINSENNFFMFLN